MLKPIYQAVIIFLLCASGCSMFKEPVVLHQEDKPVIRALASYYEPRRKGSITANGEKMGEYDLTAAHKTLPFGTIVKVRNMRNGKQVVVRINDRGPFIKGREIDLAPEPALRLGMIRHGIVPVELEILMIPKK